MKNTERLGLALPEGSDFVNIETLNENFKKLDALVDSIEQRAQVMMGSYTGTGTYGVDNPNMLEFDFKPVFIAIVKADLKPTSESWIPCLFVRPWGYNTKCSTGNTAGKTVNNCVTWGERSVSWYSIAGANENVDPDRSSSTTQLNASGVDYHYIAIG